MPQRFRPLSLLGTGMAVPASRIDAATLDAQLGRPAGWSYRQSGVAARHMCEDEDQVQLALAAARMALDDAGIGAEAIDLVLFGAAVPYQSIPATAPLIQRELGIADGACAAFDVNSTCLSFLTATDLAAHVLQGGGYRRALVVSAEIASRGLPWTDDPATAALFGDGAAAAVLEARAGPSGVVASRMETYPSGYEACELGSGGTRYDFHADWQAFAGHALFRMDGGKLYKLTVRHFGQFLDRLLDEAGWSREQVDLVVPHQASPGALAHLAKRSGFRADVVMNIVADYGNQIAASIPTALHLARRQGRLPAGAKVLMLGTSAGISFGGLALIG